MPRFQGLMRLKPLPEQVFQFMWQAQQHIGGNLRPGFRCNFQWVKLPIFDEAWEPVHRRGVTQFPGIYFLGLRWLYKRKSAFLLRASGAEDAAYLAEQIMSSVTL